MIGHESLLALSSVRLQEEANRPWPSHYRNRDRKGKASLNIIMDGVMSSNESTKQQGKSTSTLLNPIVTDVQSNETIRNPTIAEVDIQQNQNDDIDNDNDNDNVGGEDDDEYQYWLSRVKEDGLDLELAPRNLRGNEQIGMAAVQENGWSLQYALSNLQNNKEIVMIAVQNWPLALEYASPYLQSDKDVVLTAIRSSSNNNDDYGWADKVLQFASPELRKDKEVVLAAIQQNSDAIKYAHEDIKRDPDILIATGMFDKVHDDDDDDDATTMQRQKQQQTRNDNASSTIKKIVLSTRFSLDRSSESEATNFTKLLKQHPYIQSNFVVYAPNAFDKKTCDPNWTDFDHPCRGTNSTCQYKKNVVRADTGKPTDECCWRYSFRYQLEQAKDTGGFMLQLVEREGLWVTDNQPPTLGKGQTIERDMAQHLKMKIFHVYRPASRYERKFNMFHIEQVVTVIQNWCDDKGSQDDMSECIVRPTIR